MIVDDEVGFDDLLSYLHTSPFHAVIVSRDGTPWALRTDVHRGLHARELAGRGNREQSLTPEAFLALLSPATVCVLVP